MNHLEFAASESAINAAERLWLIWIGIAEDLCGHDLDGDQKTDGYSIDGALCAFEGGVTAVEYALSVKAATADIRGTP